jgi:hypothetical protein
VRNLDASLKSHLIVRTAITISVAECDAKSAEWVKFFRRRETVAQGVTIISAALPFPSLSFQTRTVTMGMKLKATGAATKHFFQSRFTTEGYRQYFRKFKTTNSKATKGKVLALLAVYAAVKNSPIGLVADLISSVQAGQSNYKWQKDHIEGAEDFLREQGMSDDGIQEVMKALKNRSLHPRSTLELSQQDQALLDQIFMDVVIESGGCVNF